MTSDRGRVADLLRPFTTVEETRLAIARGLIGLPKKNLAGLVAILSPNGTQGPSVAPDSELEPRFRFITDEEVFAEKPPGQLIDGILTQGGLSALVGPSGDGKTFLVTDWLYSIAQVGAWIGERRVQTGTAVLVAAEGSYSLGPRFRAWRSLCEVEGPIPFYIVPQPVNLMEAGEVTLFLDELPDALPIAPDLLVFDTLAQSMVGVDENTAKDMGIVIQNCNRIRESTGVALLLVHHTGHNMDRKRGSTALRAGVDTMLMLKRDEDAVLVLSCLKQKDMAAFEPIRLQLNQQGDSMVVGPSSGIGPTLSDTSLAVLHALDRSNMGDGLTSTDWEAAFTGPRSTFMLHRKRLWEESYVTRDKAGRGARYSLTPSGRTALDGEGLN